MLVPPCLVELAEEHVCVVKNTSLDLAEGFGDFMDIVNVKEVYLAVPIVVCVFIPFAGDSLAHRIQEGSGIVDL